MHDRIGRRGNVGTKYVDWEIKATLDREHGLVGVQLPTLPKNANNTVTVPDRLHDNIQSGFALWLTWAQITQSAAHLSQHVGQAKNCDVRLIQNGRERRLRNA